MPNPAIRACIANVAAASNLSPAEARDLLDRLDARA